MSLSSETALAGFSLTPSRQVMADATPPKGYIAETSLDGTHWTQQAEGEFANIAYALATQRIAFPQAAKARYLRLTFKAPATDRPVLAIANIGGFTEAR
ncbi:discoidin domain-containing protein [Altericroceibacterium spongiae]|uniref:Discoidin domain-containing protein n=1 Tax=Altericroceibacterium spongiae TaxID=2320269 RepID=A0A420E7F5_9SPHN|nr:discoidin domain-containing protein [Altericroceibacterium spongiae]RKF15469.1 discoidin domain-containing protein [Altericroceibacterium spongiae]